MNHLDKHKCLWDKDKGEKTQSRPWAGIKSEWIRTCIICGQQEKFENGKYGVFGWYRKGEL